VTLESSLPYLSVAAALAAGWTSGAGSLQAAKGLQADRGLKAAALAALAMFAYFRGIAPTAIAEALTLGAIAQALMMRGPARYASAGLIFLLGEGLVLAYLFFGVGLGPGVLIQPARLLPLAAALAVLAWGVWRLKPDGGLRLGIGAGAVVLALMAAGVLSLRWELWPAMIGLLTLATAEAARIVCGEAAGPRLRRLAWAGEYIGRVAIAYAFLR
jgi:hypothetical protein